jgi:trimeric autotransporter adhesin
MQRAFILIIFCTITLCVNGQFQTLQQNAGKPVGVSLNNKIVFIDTLTGAISSTDGTVGGTITIPSTQVTRRGNSMALFNSVLVFIGYNAATGVELWQTDGTLIGTTLIKDIFPGNANSNPEGSSDGFSVAGNTLYFSADDGVHGRELWKTDGTNAGTIMVADLNAANIEFPRFYGTSLPGKMIFLATINDVMMFNNTLYLKSGREAWVTDGTSAGTKLLIDVNNSPASTQYSNLFVGTGSFVYFLANSPFSGTELYCTNGAGTIMLSEPYSSGWHSSFLIDRDPWSFHIRDNDLYFYPDGITFYYPTVSYLLKTTPTVNVQTVKYQDLLGYIDLYNAYDLGNQFFFKSNGELYRSDGTNAGTVLLKDIKAGADSSLPHILKQRENLSLTFTNSAFIGNRFFFTADDGIHGRELWISDGTEAGTVMVKDINPGLGSAFTGKERFYYTKYKLYIVADDGIHGDELWESDGTTTGTLLISDINSGSNSSDVSFLGLAGIPSKLTFKANNGATENVYSLNSNVVPLPLTLVQFTAKLKETEVDLTWATQNEMNVSHFNIQRSVTAETFLNIGKVAATGSSSQQSYTYTDKAPEKAGNLYYRLEIVDKDGKVTYSKIQSIKVRASFDFTLISAKGEAIINLGDVNGLATIKISDANGRIQLQKKQKINAGEPVRLSTSALAAGMYFITVEYDGNIQTKRFIK